MTQQQAWFYAAKINDYKYISQYKNKYQRTQCQNGQTALMISAQNKNSIDVLRLLLNNEAQMQTQEGYSALMYSTLNNNLKAVKILVKFEQNLYLKTNSLDFPMKTTALLMGASLGNIESTNILFQYENKISHFSLNHLSHLNCDIQTIIQNDNFQEDALKIDILGRTPIFYTCFVKYNINQYEILKFYIQKIKNTAFWNRCDIYGFSILHYLVMNDNIQCIKLLFGVDQINNKIQINQNMIGTMSVETLYNQDIYTDLQFQKPKLYSQITQKPNLFIFGTKLSLAHIGCCYDSQQFIKYYGNKFISVITNSGITNKTLSFLYSKNVIQNTYQNEKEDDINIQMLKRFNKYEQYQKKQEQINKYNILNTNIYQNVEKTHKRTAQPITVQQSHQINKSDLFVQKYNNEQNVIQNTQKQSLLLKSLQKQIYQYSDSDDDYQDIDYKYDNNQQQNDQQIQNQNINQSLTKTQLDASYDLYNSITQVEQSIGNLKTDIDYQFLQSVAQKSKQQTQDISIKQEVNQQNDNKNLQQAIQKLKQSIYRHNNEQEEQEEQQYQQIDNKLYEVKNQIQKPQEEQNKQQHQQKHVLADQLQILKQQFSNKENESKQLKLVRFDDNSTKINNNISQLETYISNIK